jgi:hypothetical protein
METRSSEDRTPGRASRWPLLGLGLAGALLHIHQLLGERTFRRDAQQIYIPAKHYLAEVLRTGELPQWWPWDGLGAPMLAHPIYSTFHPSTVLYWLLPFWTAFTAQDLLGTYLALFGTWWLARTLNQPPASAFMAACLYAGNGYVMGLTEHPFMKLAAGTLPWYLAALLVAARRRGAWLVAPAIAMGLLLLAGDPQIAILASIAGVVLLLAESRDLPHVVLGVASPAVGGALAAVQLVPSLLLSGQTERATGAAGLNHWTLDAVHLAAIAMPFEVDGFAFHMGFGLAALGLAAAGIVTLRRKPLTGALVGLLVFSIWVSLGDSFGLNTVMRRIVPVWGELRFPIKSIVLGMLALALLAGEGLQQMRPTIGSRVPRLVAWIAAGASMAGSAAIFQHANVPIGPGDVRVLVGFIAIAALSFAESPGRVWLAVALVSAEVIAIGIDAMPTVRPEFYEPSPLVDVLRTHGVGLTGSSFDAFDDPPPPVQERPLRVARSAGSQNSLYGAFFGLPVLTSYSSATSLRLWRTWGSNPDLRDFTRLAGIFGESYLVLPASRVAWALSDLGADTVIGSEPTFGFTALHLRRSLPRAYAVRRGRTVESASQAGEILHGHAFKPGREVLLEGPSSRPDWADRSDAPAVEAAVASRTNSTVTLDADLPWDGFVVLNEAWFNGWSATVDGKPTPVLVANGCVRAVEAAHGRHRVVFAFQTPGLAPGAIVTALAWASCACAAIMLARKHQRNLLRHAE